MLTWTELAEANGLIAKIENLSWKKQQAIRDGKGLFTINSQIAACKRRLGELGVSANGKDTKSGDNGAAA